jgi:endoglycosylceramidase
MLADRYRDQPAVVGFEPMNEPFPGWWGLLHFKAWYEERLHPFYERVGRAVQSVDPRYLIFVDISPLENTGIRNTARPKPAVENLVFAPHYYDLGYVRFLWFNPGGGASAMRRGLNRHLALAREWNAPVFVGEFGVSMHRDDGAGYLTKLYTVFDELHLSGTIWEASMSDLLWNLRNKGIMAPDGAFKPAAHAIDRPYPRAVAGLIETFTFEPRDSRFDLVWTEGTQLTAPTEVYLPRRFYADRPQVRVEPDSELRFDPETRVLSVAALGGDLERRLVATP